ncbi:MAG: acyltransferase [Bacteroidales bacterium]|nr:acyltransferase [Bacteroidales bacterium]
MKQNILFKMYFYIWRGGFYILGKLSTWIYNHSINDIGYGNVFRHGVYIDNPNQIIVGNHCLVEENVVINSEIASSTLSIANNVQISHSVKIDYSGGISIGNNVVISSLAILYTHDHGYIPKSEPTLHSLVVGDMAWIGSRAIILPHVRFIGRRAVIGAGAVVSRSVPEKAIVVGNPAKIVGYVE